MSQTTGKHMGQELGKVWNTPALCSDSLSPRPPTSVSSITELSKLLEELESIKRFI